MITVSVRVRFFLRPPKSTGAADLSCERRTSEECYTGIEIVVMEVFSQFD